MGKVSRTGRQGRSTGRNSSGTSENVVERWYPFYFSQCWYATTFLINHAFGSSAENDSFLSAIGKGRKRKTNERARPLNPRDAKEVYHWNNIWDSGCYFACLAMIVEIDPAHLATAWGAAPKFRDDSSYMSVKLASRRRLTRGLMWDSNYPRGKRSEDRIVNLPRIWHPTEGLCGIKVERVAFPRQWTRVNRAAANAFVDKARKHNYHIICGDGHHAALVAGRKDGKYFVFDPDPTDDNDEVDYDLLKRIVDGRYTLFDFIGSKKAVSFACYEVTRTRLHDQAAT